jgi:hypothetical protein
MTAFVYDGSNMDCHARYDGLRSCLTAEANNAKKREDALRVDAVSGGSQTGLMVSSYYPVEQP